MANKQATIKGKVKFSDLTKSQQDSIYKYYQVVKKLFLVTQTSDAEPMNTADYKFGDDIFKFLHTIDTIFGEKQPKSDTSEDLSTEQFILESCLTNSRLTYRKQFRGYSYLTVHGLENAHILVRDEAVLKLAQNRLKFKLNDKEMAALGKHLLSALLSERLWINEVNNFKKNDILSEIKTEILENLNLLVHEELPLLTGKNSKAFYDRATFRQKIMQISTTALQSFQEQIPFKEDQLSEAKICEEFQSKVDKALEELASKNRRNTYNAKELMTAEVDSSVAKYTNAICSIFNEEPMAEPYNIRSQHETLQELHLPIPKNPDSIKDDLRSKCLQNYFQETDKIFQEQIRKNSEICNESLNECYQELCAAAGGFVQGEIVQILQQRKIPTKYVAEIRKNLHDQLENVIEDIRDSTIANPKVAENLALSGRPSTSTDFPGNETRSDLGISMQEDDGASLLQVNMRVLTGRTYKLNAYSFWTIRVLKQKFMKCVGAEYASCTLYHKVKKLRDENTIQSYNIKNGDFLNAKLSTHSF